VAAVAAAQSQEAVSEDAAFEEASNSSFTNCGNSAPAMASASAMKVAACCCTKRFSVVCSGR
jgi:hypothetical protein